jgi:hypothetical protein
MASASSRSEGDESHNETRERVITACTERFERRLVEEISGVRVQIAHAESIIP